MKRPNIEQSEIALYCFNKPNCKREQIMHDLNHLAPNTINKYLRGRYKKNRYIRGRLITMNHIIPHGTYTYGENIYDDDFTFNTEFAYHYPEIKNLLNQELKKKLANINTDYVLNVEKKLDKYMKDLIDISLNFEIKKDGKQFYLDDKDYLDFREVLINIMNIFFKKKSIFFIIEELAELSPFSIIIHFDFMKNFDNDKRELFHQLIFLPAVFMDLKTELKEDPSFYYKIGKEESRNGSERIKKRKNRERFFKNLAKSKLKELMPKVKEFIDDDKYYENISNWLAERKKLR